MTTHRVKSTGLPLPPLRFGDKDGHTQSTHGMSTGTVQGVVYGMAFAKGGRDPLFGFWKRQTPKGGKGRAPKAITEAERLALYLKYR